MTRRKGLILAVQSTVLFAVAWLAVAMSSTADWASWELAALLFVLAVGSDMLTVEVRTVRVSGAFLAIVLAMAQRGPGNWDLLHEQAARCRRLGVPVTFIAVMLRTNFDRLAEIARIAKAYEAPLRINVYQSVRTDAFALTYEQYWDGFERLLAETDVIAIGEPLVRAMAGMPPRQGGCGVATVRVTPRATVQPCVYWPGGGDPLDVLLDLGPDVVHTVPFKNARAVPSPCLDCAFRATCAGGCAGRRRLMDALDQPDPYCPVIRGDDRRLRVRMASARELPKLESACTTVVVAR